MEISCLCRVLLYTDNELYLNLGFNYSTQTVVFTLNLDSRNYSLHRQVFNMAAKRSVSDNIIKTAGSRYSSLCLFVLLILPTKFWVRIKGTIFFKKERITIIGWFDALSTTPKPQSF